VNHFTTATDRIGTREGNYKEKESGKGKLTEQQVLTQKDGKRKEVFGMRGKKQNRSPREEIDENSNRKDDVKKGVTTRRPSRPETKLKEGGLISKIGLIEELVCRSASRRPKQRERAE